MNNNAASSLLEERVERGYGLIIGRFQPLHLGHQLLISTSLKENLDTLVLIGSVNKENSQNPYSYQCRKNLIESIYNKDISVGDLPDFPNDEQWIDFILTYIPKDIKELTLYCGDIKNDSAVSSLISLETTLPFKLKVKEIPRSIIAVSATQVRAWIIEGNTKKLQKYIGEKTLLSLGI